MFWPRVSPGSTDTVSAQQLSCTAPRSQDERHQLNAIFIHSFFLPSFIYSSIHLVHSHFPSTLMSSAEPLQSCRAVPWCAAAVLQTAISKPSVRPFTGKILVWLQRGLQGVQLCTGVFKALQNPARLCCSCDFSLL